MFQMEFTYMTNNSILIDKGHHVYNLCQIHLLIVNLQKPTAMIYMDATKRKTSVSSPLSRYWLLLSRLYTSTAR